MLESIPGTSTEQCGFLAQWNNGGLDRVQTCL